MDRMAYVKVELDKVRNLKLSLILRRNWFHKNMKMVISFLKNGEKKGKSFYQKNLLNKSPLKNIIAIWLSFWQGNSLNITKMITLQQHMNKKQILSIKLNNSFSEGFLRLLQAASIESAIIMIVCSFVFGRGPG